MTLDEQAALLDELEALTRRPAPEALDELERLRAELKDAKRELGRLRYED